MPPLPLVLLHGFGETRRTWDLVLPALGRACEVLAPTLPGHMGGPPMNGAATEGAVLEAVERAMDDAGFETAHIAGNSLGGYAALKLAERGRARSVVALAPAGGWAGDDESWRDVLAWQADARRGLRAPPRTTVNPVPSELMTHLGLAFRSAPAALELIDHALAHGYAIDPERITCPVRVIWGAKDELLPWPSAAARYRNQWLPHADWVVLDDVGHAPQLDAPLVTAQLILDFVS